MATQGTVSATGLSCLELFRNHSFVAPWIGQVVFHSGDAILDTTRRIQFQLSILRIRYAY